MVYPSCLCNRFRPLPAEPVDDPPRRAIDAALRSVGVRS